MPLNKGDIPLKACWHCCAIMPIATHVCPCCATSQQAYIKASHRQSLKQCAQGKHDYRHGECFYCETPEVKP